MQNVWRVPGRFSGMNPPSAAAGEPPDPPLKPPDPPNQKSPLSPNNFPTLSDAKTFPKTPRSKTTLSSNKMESVSQTTIASMASAVSTGASLPPVNEKIHPLRVSGVYFTQSHQET
ncbi:unnamed protein product [Eruca vesicaria subsp. sativa]|uniref:Uncharacterized protein n=1 Tax=Eruca vesicaria subsp. sativa TaxID=29727 RepID=A0ABC8LU50_ERUVS|nr:unnamed protein product [Eruca vesicaria subsp. sativa]